MTPDLFKALLMPVVESLAERCRNLEARVAALEASQPEPLTFPPIDLGLIEGSK